MPSTINTTLLALHAVVFFLSGWAGFRVIASPVLVSPTHTQLAANYSPRTESNTTQDPSPFGNIPIARRDLSDLRSSNPAIAPHSATPHPLHRRDDPWLHYNRTVESYDKLESLAKQSAHMARNDNDFQRNCVSQASDYRINLLGLQHLLEELGADKGLANYNSRDVLQVLLKDTTNLNKNALKAIADMIYCIPALGPLLGPIVYEIKCILDAILDLCENLSDATLNALKPLVIALIGQASRMACGSELLGLCLDP